MPAKKMYSYLEQLQLDDKMNWLIKISIEIIVLFFIIVAKDY